MGYILFYISTEYVFEFVSLSCINHHTTHLAIARYALSAPQKKRYVLGEFHIPRNTLGIGLPRNILSTSFLSSVGINCVNHSDSSSY